jgi:polyisoprenyl-phosphate glycosyltransferase
MEVAMTDLPVPNNEPVLPTISVVTAFYNEAENLPLFRERVTALLETLPARGEIVLLDDHSNDASPAIAKRWAAEDARVKYIRLSRNSGSHVAFSAGLRYAAGDCAVLLAADLQDPPETVPQLLERWHEGSDVVWAVRIAREGERWSTKALAAGYYWLMRRVALPDMPAKGADFLLVDRKVIDAYNEIAEKNTSILAMILWMGFQQSFVPYVKQARHGGRSKWTITKKLKLFVDSLVSFSYAPIRIMSLAGSCMALAGFAYALFVVVGRLAGWVQTGTGFAALMTVLLVGQGTTMIMLGVLGEYVWRTYDESRGGGGGAR